MGVAFSRSVPEMMVFRCVQALGTSGGMSVGGAIIGDIYKLTERGTAMGVFFGVRLCPEHDMVVNVLILHHRPVCLDLRLHRSSEVRYFPSEVYGTLSIWIGWGAHYASWRLTQFCLGLAGLFTCLLMFFFLPETSHPGSRGIEKVWAASDSDKKPFKWVWLNPLSSLRLMRSPVLLLMV